MKHSNWVLGNHIFMLEIATKNLYGDFKRFFSELKRKQ